MHFDYIIVNRIFNAFLDGKFNLFVLLKSTFFLMYLNLFFLCLKKKLKTFFSDLHKSYLSIYLHMREYHLPMILVVKG